MFIEFNSLSVETPCSFMESSSLILSGPTLTQVFSNLCLATKSIQFHIASYFEISLLE